MWDERALAAAAVVLSFANANRVAHAGDGTDTAGYKHTARGVVAAETRVHNTMVSVRLERDVPLCTDTHTHARIR